ncbi:MAG TPA: hypothetical protein VLR90_15420 [Blastocatellia bacterium]|nr:hypothetical protein [Blastocatellia bacterium]
MLKAKGEEFMVKKILSLTLVCLLAHLAYAQSVSASTKAEKETQFAGKVRAGIAKLGTGPEARVEVKLSNKQKLAGYVSESNPESFTVVDAKGQATLVAYTQVKQVQGNNLSLGMKIAITAGVIIGLLILIAALTIPET